MSLDIYPCCAAHWLTLPLLALQFYAHQLMEAVE